MPPSELPALRNQILLQLKEYAGGPKPIRVQLCVCLAILAIQMKDWNDVLPTVVQSLGDSSESHACILDFLRVLPEEVTAGRKINLSVCGYDESIRRTILRDVQSTDPQRYHVQSLIVGNRKKILRTGQRFYWRTMRTGLCSS